MRKFVAIASVSVAFLSAVSPAFAEAPMNVSFINGTSSGYQSNTDNIDQRNYWSERSEYYVATVGTSGVSATAPRRVLISGWHPLEGFEAETAAEARNRAANARR